MLQKELGYMRSYDDQQWLLGVAARLKQAREEKIMSRFKNANQAWGDIIINTGISRQQFVNYEKGFQEPKISWLTRLCDHYDIDFHWIVYGKPLALIAKEMAGLLRERKPSTEAEATNEAAR